jgi:hypothetical protein
MSELRRVALSSCCSSSVLCFFAHACESCARVSPHPIETDGVGEAMSGNVLDAMNASMSKRVPHHIEKDEVDEP